MTDLVVQHCLKDKWRLLGNMQDFWNHLMETSKNKDSGDPSGITFDKEYLSTEYYKINKTEPNDNDDLAIDMM